MDMAMLVPSFRIVVLIGALYVGWWALGDFVLDRIGIPFLDMGSRRSGEERGALTTD